MKVIQLLTTTAPKGVVECYNKAYPNYQTTEEEYRKRFLEVIKDKILERTSYVMEISHVKVEHDDPIDDKELIDVSLLIDGIRHSPSFQPWGVILGCELTCNIHFPFSREQQAAELYWELMFHGGEEESLDLKITLTDTVDQIKDTENGEDLPEGVFRIPVLQPSASSKDSPDYSILDAIFPDDTPEEKAARRLDMDKMLVNHKTRREYINGVLVGHSSL